MSNLGIGRNDISEEHQALRDRLASKDSECTALKDELTRRQASFNDFEHRLNETLCKLAFEADRATKLDSDYTRCSEELRRERTALQNLEITLSKEKELLVAEKHVSRELQATIESLAHKSNNAEATAALYDREKTKLGARILELEQELRQSNTRAAPSGIPRPGRRRSSSVQDFHTHTAQQEVHDLRKEVASKDANLRTVTERLEAAIAKLSTAQSNLMKTENEKIANEKQLHAQIQQLKAHLEEKEYELQAMVAQGNGGGEREDELIRRVEEDEATIAALQEALQREQRSASNAAALEKHKLEEKLRIQEAQLRELEGRTFELVREKEEALGELEEARSRVDTATNDLRAQEVQHRSLQDQLAAATTNPVLDPGDVTITSPPTASNYLESCDESTATHIADLLNAVDRLRDERDSLRQRLGFMEEEYRFSKDALEQKLVSALAFPKETEHSSGILDLRRKLEHSGRAMLAICLVASHLHSAVDDERAKGDLAYESHVAAEDALAMANRTTEEVESVRDSYALQVTNLQTDLDNAQQALEEAEVRYTTLQMHQLAEMSTSDATRALRDQVEEFEAKLVRRNEQITVQQREIKRLDTNLRLHEERIAEMTTEMETLINQKEAMIEDCAAAREDRDESAKRVDDLELELEELESTLTSRELEITTLVGIVAQAVSKLRTQRIVNDLPSCPGGCSAEADTASNISDDESSEQVRGAMVALATVCSQFKITRGRLVAALADGSRLGGQVVSLTDRVAELESLQKDAADASDKSDESRQLQEHITSLEKDLAEARQAREDINTQHQELLNKIVELRENYSRHTTTASQRAREYDQEIAAMVSKNAEVVGDLEARLAHAQEESCRLQTKLEAEATERESERDQWKQDVGGLTARANRAELAESQLNATLVSTTEQLTRVHQDIAGLRKEKEALEVNLAELRAEAQRSVHLTAALEAASTESSRSIFRLEQALEHTRGELMQSEKTGKAAEISLSLQKAQHDQDLSLLRRELEAYRSAPKLDAMVADLQEKNERLETLLREKCEEIENNDDQWIESLKEKKKLLSKIESLNRKLAVVQAKLAAAQESAAAHVAKSSSSSPAVVSMQSKPTSHEPVPPLPVAPITDTQTPTSRSVSAPLPLREVTPPLLASRQPVFKTKTPERRTSASTSPRPVGPPPPPMAGQKRRAPDEFDEDVIPSQAVVAAAPKESTPRLRRALQNVHNGFTPVKSSVKKSSELPRSPARRATTALGQGFGGDVTNSPNLTCLTEKESSKAPKRNGWLSKIKGGAASQNRPVGV